ncbi:hypothetical protein ACLOJK_015949 [Asimina triloba]
MHKLCSHQSFSPILFLYFLTLCSVFPSISSSTNSFISSGSSLSVERPYDVLRSQDGTFSAGFHSVGINAYSFAIWFAQAKEFTPVWMANREYPVNGRRSVLSLQSDGNLVLKDGARSVIWTTKTTSNSSVQLRLENTGNLVLLNTQLGNEILWQSFDSPTNTLLPGQQLTRSSKLVSSRSETNHSSGFYSLYFDNDNVLRMLFNGPEISSVYWPPPFLHTWESGRSTYNSSRISVLDSSGEFHSSDALLLNASDLGSGPKRRLTMDFDGNLRVYSLDEEKGSWGVSWQAIPRTCAIHGVCGPNSVCVHNPERKCSCLPGFKMKDPRDLSQGCEPSFSLSSRDPQASAFIALPHVDFVVSIHVSHIGQPVPIIRSRPEIPQTLKQQIVCPDLGTPSVFRPSHRAASPSSGLLRPNPGTLRSTRLRRLHLHRIVPSLVPQQIDESDLSRKPSIFARLLQPVRSEICVYLPVRRRRPSADDACTRSSSPNLAATAPAFSIVGAVSVETHLLHFQRRPLQTSALSNRCSSGPRIVRPASSVNSSSSRLRS